MIKATNIPPHLPRFLPSLLLLLSATTIAVTLWQEHLTQVSHLNQVWVRHSAGSCRPQAQHRHQDLCVQLVPAAAGALPEASPALLLRPSRGHSFSLCCECDNLRFCTQVRPCRICPTTARLPPQVRGLPSSPGSASIHLTEYNIHLQESVHDVEQSPCMYITHFFIHSS